MKRILNANRGTDRDNCLMPECHIDLLRIHAFASTNVNFTEKETVHFDLCRSCRIKVIDALRTWQRQLEQAIMPKAA